MLRCLIPAQVDPVLGWLHVRCFNSWGKVNEAPQAEAQATQGLLVTCQALVKGTAGRLVVGFCGADVMQPDCSRVQTRALSDQQGLN